MGLNTIIEYVILSAITRVFPRVMKSKYGVFASRDKRGATPLRPKTVETTLKLTIFKIFISNGLLLEKYEQRDRIL